MNINFSSAQKGLLQTALCHKILRDQIRITCFINRLKNMCNFMNYKSCCLPIFLCYDYQIINKRPCLMLT